MCGVLVIIKRYHFVQLITILFSGPCLRVIGQEVAGDWWAGFVAGNGCVCRNFRHIGCLLSAF